MKGLGSRRKPSCAGSTELYKIGSGSDLVLRKTSHLDCLLNGLGNQVHGS